MPYMSIEVRRDGPITVFVLNRPEVLNALHAEAQFELDQALDQFAADPDQWVAILTGSGDRAFCSGGDLKALAKDGGRRRPVNGFGGLTSRFNLNKPLIAAVNGIAFGGGFEAALACDLILASETARFGLLEPRYGLAALGGGLHRLAREVGPKRALGMILAAREVDAAEGFRLGFVNDVVPAAELISVALRWAREICQLSPMAVRASKEALYRGLAEPSVEAAIRQQRNYPALQALAASDDMREGLRAFAEKRAPAWYGK